MARFRFRFCVGGAWSSQQSQRECGEGLTPVHGVVCAEALCSITGAHDSISRAIGPTRDSAGAPESIIAKELRGRGVRLARRSAVDLSAALPNNRAISRRRTNDHDDPPHRPARRPLHRHLRTAGRRRGAGGGDVWRHLRGQLQEVSRRRLREGHRRDGQVRARQLGADDGQAARGGRPLGARRGVHGQPDRQAGQGRGAAPAARAGKDRRAGTTSTRSRGTRTRTGCR